MPGVIHTWPFSFDALCGQRWTWLSIIFLGAMELGRNKA
jgi:hypothetical protein